MEGREGGGAAHGSGEAGKAGRGRVPGDAHLKADDPRGEGGRVKQHLLHRVRQGVLGVREGRLHKGPGGGTRRRGEGSMSRGMRKGDRREIEGGAAEVRR